MKVHTTNYTNTFIEVADDCVTTTGLLPPNKIKKTIANYQFDLIYNQPYEYLSDKLIFKIFALRKNLLDGDIDGECQTFFSKGQPCLRTSPLAKQYGWGIHFNSEGKIAIYSIDSNEYQSFINDKSVKKIKAMRSKKA